MYVYIHKYTYQDMDDKATRVGMGAVCVYRCICVYTCIYIYIFIYRERYVYIYIDI